MTLAKWVKQKLYFPSQRNHEVAGWATVQGELQEWTGGWVSTVTWSYTEVVTGYVVHFQ